MELDRELAMRALESDYDAYADRYQETANDPRSGLDGDANWDLFEELWAKRNESKDDMAELLSTVMGVSHDDALAWVEGRDTP